MAVRYSGNIELRMRLVRMRGWNHQMGWFYKALLRAPRYHGEGILSLREVGVDSVEEARAPEGYDKAAKAFLDLAVKSKDGAWIRKHGVKKLLGWEILRVQQAPCPLEDELEVRRRGQGSRSRSRSR